MKPVKHITKLAVARFLERFDHVPEYVAVRDRDRLAVKILLDICHRAKHTDTYPSGMFILEDEAYNARLTVSKRTLVSITPLIESTKPVIKQPTGRK